MTLVVCYIEKEKIHCMADSRLSSGEGTLMDSGGKISIIPIAKTKFNESIEGTERYSLGFAYAGSSILANNTHFIASTCTQIITSKSDGLPAASMIANIYRSVAEHVTRDFNSRRQNNYQFFSSFVFGFCPVDQAFRLFEITRSLDAGFSMQLQSLDLKEGDAFTMGSGSEEFSRRLRAAMESPYDVFKSMIEDVPVKDVGGFINVATATVNSVDIVPILMPSQDDPEKVMLTVNGFDTTSISVDGFSFGLSAFEHGLPKVLARQALREKGIDPDSNVSEAIQNTAVFELFLRDALINPKKLFLKNKSFILNAPMPVAGKYYYLGACVNCGVDTPFLIDESAGQSDTILIGPGSLQTTCFLCGKQTFADPINLKRSIWK